MKKTTQQIKKIRSTWYIWFFPVIAIGVCAWMFLEYRKQQGPEIRLHFNDASGIQTEKTRVRFRGVTIGVVKRVTISPDNKEVIAHILLQKEAGHFAVEGSRFSLIMPKVGLQGVSGLETIFEGSYIAALPGSPEGERKHEFDGQLGGEPTDSLENTSTYLLETDNADSLGSGDAVTFRGLRIGQISNVSLSKSAQKVLVTINVQNKYVKLIRTNTAFWRKVGVQANLGLFNSEVKINSLDSLLNGGIELFTPDQVGEIAKGGQKFELLGAAPKGWEKWNPILEFN